MPKNDTVAIRSKAILNLFMKTNINLKDVSIEEVKHEKKI